MEPCLAPLWRLCCLACFALPGQDVVYFSQMQADQIYVEPYQLLYDDRHALLEGVEDVLVGIRLAEAHPQVGDGVPGHGELLSVVDRADAVPVGLVVHQLPGLQVALLLLESPQQLLLLSLKALLRQRRSQQVCLQLERSFGVRWDLCKHLCGDKYLTDVGLLLGQPGLQARLAPLQAEALLSTRR